MSKLFTMNLRVEMDSAPKLGVLKVKLEQVLADAAVAPNIITIILTQTETDVEP